MDVGARDKKHKVSLFPIVPPFYHMHLVFNLNYAYLMIIGPAQMGFFVYRCGGILMVQRSQIL